MQILMTNPSEVRAREVIDVYCRRWPIELLVKELKEATASALHQVPKESQQAEYSAAISVKVSGA
jgi:hypothetical protein